MPCMLAFSGRRSDGHAVRSIGSSSLLGGASLGVLCRPHLGRQQVPRGPDAQDVHCTLAPLPRLCHCIHQAACSAKQIKTNPVVNTRLDDAKCIEDSRAAVNMCLASSRSSTCPTSSYVGHRPWHWITHLWAPRTWAAPRQWWCGRCRRTSWRCCRLPCTCGCPAGPSRPRTACPPACPARSPVDARIRQACSQGVLTESARNLSGATEAGPATKIWHACRSCASCDRFCWRRKNRWTT